MTPAIPAGSEMSRPRRGEADATASARDEERPDAAALLPALTRQLRVRLRRLRIAEAKVGDEAPVVRHREVAPHCRGIENRNPAEPHALGPRREPQRVHRTERRVEQRLRHGPETEAVGPSGVDLGDNGELVGHIIEIGRASGWDAVGTYGEYPEVAVAS